MRIRHKTSRPAWSAALRRAEHELTLNAKSLGVIDEAPPSTKKSRRPSNSVGSQVTVKWAGTCARCGLALEVGKLAAYGSPRFLWCWDEKPCIARAESKRTDTVTHLSEHKQKVDLIADRTFCDVCGRVVRFTKFKSSAPRCKQHMA